MEWLFATVTPGQRTLETGCGYSTIIFALKGANHTVISPMPDEHQRIREWCASHGVDLSAVRFVCAKSEQVLPSEPAEPLDLVLIDGWHAFPAPYLDWFFTASRLKADGLVIVDDTQVLACRVLRDFLSAEAGRWRLHRHFKRTDVFQRLDRPVFEGDWRSQPWGAQPITSIADRMARAVRLKLVWAVKQIPPLEKWLKRRRASIRTEGSLSEARRGSQSSHPHHVQ